MDYETFLRRVPKVELHCHVEGTVRAATAADQARKHGVQLPTEEVDQLYTYDTIYDFLKIYGLVTTTLVDRGDFARVAYETLEDGANLGNLKYREMFFDPTLHTKRGVPYATVVDGLVDGIRAAEKDHGVRCRLIACVYRQDDLATAEQMLDEVLAHRPAELLGLGMDAAEAPDPPEKFASVFQRAGRAGLHRTSHASEDAPPRNITTCLDVLGCERIDHGYHILEDEEVIARCRDQRIYFTCCPTSTAIVYGWPDLTQHPIKGMVEQGLQVMLNSDDPTMFHTDVGKEYVDLCTALGYGPDRVREVVMNGVEAAWLDDSERAEMRRSFAAEFDELLAQTPGPVVR
jgi:adenosine deaminase